MATRNKKLLVKFPTEASSPLSTPRTLKTLRLAAEEETHLGEALAALRARRARRKRRGGVGAGSASGEREGA